jgi:hypothetical protein
MKFSRCLTLVFAAIGIATIVILLAGCATEKKISKNPGNSFNNGCRLFTITPVN